METNGRDMVETLIRLAFASAKKKEQDKEEGALPTEEANEVCTSCKA